MSGAYCLLFREQGKESAILHEAIKPINKHLEPALRTFLDGDLVDAIKLAFDDSIPLKERHDRITAVMVGS